MAAPGKILPIGKIAVAGDIGRLIRERRKASGATQADLAAVAGVGVRFLSELERGKATAELGKTLQVLQRVGFDVWIKPRGKP